MVRPSLAAAFALVAFLLVAGPALATDLPLQGIHDVAGTTPVSSSGSSGGSAPPVYQIQGTPVDPLRNAASQDPATQGSASLAPPSSLLPWALPVLAAGGLAALVHRSLRRVGTEEPSGRRESDAEGEREARRLEGWPPRAGISGVLALGRNAADRGDYEEAIRWFETAIAVKPQLAVAHTCLGLCLTGLERDDEALESFRAAVDLDPEDALPRYQLARALARLRRMEEVLDVLGPVLEDVPDLRDAARLDPSFRDLRDHPRFLAILRDL